MRVVALLAGMILVGFGSKSMAICHLLNSSVKHGFPVIEEVALRALNTTGIHQAIFKVLMTFNSSAFADVCWRHTYGFQVWRDQQATVTRDGIFLAAHESDIETLQTRTESFDS